MTSLMFGVHGLESGVLLSLFLHFAMLSLLGVGGAITAAPDMQRYLVGESGWLSDAQFTSSVAIAQAAPGPNVLFVAVLGWNVAGLSGVVATMAGCLLPSTALALAVSRYGERRRDSRAMRAFRAGMSPLTLGLLLATGWVLTDPLRGHAATALLVAVAVGFMLWTRLSPLWPIAIGAAVGAAGFMG